jgi:bifunctional UDP-N-acetylglucosamine pyrophosphorylase / glucosamine-1-phosphate N-acetyltransferase
MKFAIVIMAAGKGTRLKSKRPKVLHEIGGKPLLAHVIAAAKSVVPAEDVYVVIGHEAERVRNAVAATGVNFVLQTEQRGTGHAIQSAQSAVEKYDDFLVLSGDAPLIRRETIAAIRDFHVEQKAAMTILAASPSDSHGYGRVIRKHPASVEVLAVVEQKALSPEQEKIKEVNSGFYAFQTGPLYRHILELKTANAHGEYYLTDMAGILTAAGERVVALEAEFPEEILGANTIAELVQLDSQLREATVRKLMSQGVTIFRPETSFIDAEVEVGADTIIEPGVQLLGKTKIGQDCRIRSNSVLENAEIGDDVVIRQGSIIADSKIAAGAIIGPYSHIRPGCEIGEQAHVGNFVETKKVKLGKGSKASHLTYLGDAVIGAGVNVGAGTITCNYDGVNKHTTTVGEGVFVGSHSTLVAPVKVGDGAFIAAGSCVTEDVPADALAMGRSRQTNIEGWAKKRREMQAKSRKL